MIRKRFIKRKVKCPKLGGLYSSFNKPINNLDATVLYIKEFDKLNGLRPADYTIQGRGITT